MGIYRVTLTSSCRELVRENGMFAARRLLRELRRVGGRVVGDKTEQKRGKQLSAGRMATRGRGGAGRSVSQM